MDPSNFISAADIAFIKQMTNIQSNSRAFEQLINFSSVYGNGIGTKTGRIGASMPSTHDFFLNYRKTHIEMYVSPGVSHTYQNQSFIPNPKFLTAAIAAHNKGLGAMMNSWFMKIFQEPIRITNYTIRDIKLIIKCLEKNKGHKFNNKLAYEMLQRFKAEYKRNVIANNNIDEVMYKVNIGFYLSRNEAITIIHRINLFSNYILTHFKKTGKRSATHSKRTLLTRIQVLSLNLNTLLREKTQIPLMDMHGKRNVLDLNNIPGIAFNETLHKYSK